MDSRAHAGAENIDGVTNPPAEDPITPGGDAYGYAKMPAPYVTKFSARVTGELFFRDAGRNQDGHCTASVITSESGSLIITAAHCVVSFTNAPPPPAILWSENLLFVPAYNGAERDPRMITPFGNGPSRAYTYLTSPSGAWRIY